MPIQGFLEDYVFVIQALFDLYEASLEQDWLEWALQLQHMQDKLFWDSKGFAYFSSEAGDPSLLLRLKGGELRDVAMGSRVGQPGEGRAGGPSHGVAGPWADGGAVVPCRPRRSRTHRQLRHCHKPAPSSLLLWPHGVGRKSCADLGRLLREAAEGPDNLA